MINRKLYYIEWLDHVSFSISTWRTEEEFDELLPVKCQTVGWVLRETKDYFIIVSTRNERVDKEVDEDSPENYLGDLLILKATIQNMKELKK